MLDGKKAVAEKQVYSALENASAALKKKPVEVLDTALEHVKPALEIRARRVGGANYQVPMPVEEERQEALAVRWIITAARRKKGKKFESILTEELVNAFNNEGDAVKIKQETERMAEANKAFAHFRW